MNPERFIDTTKEYAKVMANEKYEINSDYDECEELVQKCESKHKFLNENHNLWMETQEELEQTRGVVNILSSQIELNQQQYLQEIEKWDHDIKK